MEKMRGSRENLYFRMADDPVERIITKQKREEQLGEADPGKEAREVASAAWVGV